MFQRCTQSALNLKQNSKGHVIFGVVALLCVVFYEVLHSDETDTRLNDLIRILEATDTRESSKQHNHLGTDSLQVVITALVTYG